MMQRLVATGSTVHKASAGGKFTEKLNPFCNFDLQHSSPVSQYLLRSIMMYHQDTFVCNKTNSSDNTVVVIYYLYEPSLSPSLWRYKTSLSAWHYNSCWCNACQFWSQKVQMFITNMCEQTFFHILNLCCDLQWRKPIFSKKKQKHYGLYHHNTTFDWKTICISENILETVMLW